MRKYSGVKISFEGVDGSGKTTQIRLLEKKLLSLGYKVFVASDNSNTNSSGIDGKILSLLSVRKDRFFRIGFPETEALLLAARASYLDETEIVSKLKKGYVVLCDRDIDTFVAYGYASLRCKYPKENGVALIVWLQTLVKYGRTCPDMTVLFNPTISFLERATIKNSSGSETKPTKDIFDEESRKFINRVFFCYNFLAKAYPKRIIVEEIKDLTINEVFGLFLTKVQKFLIKKNVPRD